jgi:hypothetical protein
MSSRVPDWTLRSCSEPGCYSYARTHCHAWDKEAIGPCHLPLCEAHAWKSGSLRFCNKHRTGSHKSELSASPEKQSGLFDPPEF